MKRVLQCYLMSLACLLSLLCNTEQMVAKSSTKCMLQTLLCKVNQLSEDVAAQKMLGCTSIAITSAGEIGVSGIYHLANDIYGTIEITAPNVSLDLCGHTIYPAVASNGVRAITRNGAEVHGIHIGVGADFAVVENHSLSGGISGFLNGSGIYNEANFVQIGEIKCFSNKHGFSSSNANACYLRNCWTYNTGIGFYLDTCSSHVLFGCKAVGTHYPCQGLCSQSVAMSDVHGIFAINGTSNAFEECTVEGVTAGGNADASGITVANERESKIIGCKTDGILSQLGAASGISLQAVPTEAAVPVACGSNTMPITHAVAWRSGEVPAVTLAASFDSAGIYSFLGNVLSGPTLLSDVNPNSYACAWSTDGDYLAVGGNNGSSNGFFVYTPDRQFKVFQAVASGLSVTALAWGKEANSSYIAVGCGNSGAAVDLIYVYFFNGSTLVLKAPSQFHKASPYSVSSLSWSPDGTYLAAAVKGSASDDIAGVVYTFDSVSGLSDEKDINISNLNGLSVAWHPYLQEPQSPYYLALCGAYLPASAAPNFFMYSFDGTSVPVQQASATELATASSLSWVPSGDYIVVASNNGSTQQVLLYNSSVPANLKLQAIPFDELPAGPLALDWSADGQYLAVGGAKSGAGSVCIYEPLQHSSNCVAQDNLVNDVASYAGISVGYHASSLLNYVAQNTALNVAVPYIGVSPTLVADQESATLVAGNVYSGIESKIGETIIDTLKNATGQTIFINSNSLHSGDEIHDVHIPTQKPNAVNTDLCVSISDTLGPISPNHVYLLYDFNYALWDVNAAEPFPDPLIYCKCNGIKVTKPPVHIKSLTVLPADSLVPTYFVLDFKL